MLPAGALERRATTSVSLMSLLDEIRNGTYVAQGGTLVVPGNRPSLADVEARVRRGDPVLASVRDFLDVAGRAAPDVLQSLVSGRPELTGDPRADALLGGIAEHCAVTSGFPCPRWALEHARFLDRFWFVSDVVGFRAIAIAQTPVSLKRRGIFWPERSLRTV